MNKSSRILLSIISTGLILSSINFAFQYFSNQNFRGIWIERSIYWITLLSIFGYALRRPLKKHRLVFFITFSFFLLIQCSQIFVSGNLSTERQIHLNKKYTLRSGASPVTLPITRIFEKNFLLEKEVSQRYVHMGSYNFSFTSINSIDSASLVKETDSIFILKFFKDENAFEQILRKTSNKINSDKIENN